MFKVTINEVTFIFPSLNSGDTVCIDTADSFQGLAKAPEFDDNPSLFPEVSEALEDEGVEEVPEEQAEETPLCEETPSMMTEEALSDVPSELVDEVTDSTPVESETSGGIDSAFLPSEEAEDSDVSKDDSSGTPESGNLA